MSYPSKLFSSHCSNASGFGGLVFICWLAWLSFPQPGFAQETSTEKPTPTSPATDQDDDGIRLGPEVVTLWEFGAEVKAAGNATGVAVVSPIPMNWPEQEVEMIEQFKTDKVAGLKTRKQLKLAQKLEFKVSRMSAGQVESAYYRLRIKKKMIQAPKDPSQFSISKSVPARIRTFLKPSPSIESKHHRITEIANSLWDDSLSGWEQVEKNLLWVRNNIEYKFDVTLRTCLDALDKKQGDCEELSSLFIAICRAQGIPARAVWIPDHTYPEFYLEDASGKGHWFPCQAAGQYEFGSMTEAKPILQKGDRFRIPGHKLEIRYLQPTLTARNAAPNAGLSLRWIKRMVGQER